MKEAIQPKYHDVVVRCSCGAEFTCGSTVPGDVIKVEVCSKCHPFTLVNKNYLILVVE